MGTKVVIAILVVLVVLFVVGVAAPAVSGGDQQANPKGWLADTLRGLFERPLDLQADAQITPPDCVQGRALVLPAGGTCTLAVKTDTGMFASTRKLDVRLDQGLAQVHVEQSDGLNIDHTLKPDDPSMTINVFQKGATVTVVCAGGLQACQLALPQ